MASRGIRKALKAVKSPNSSPSRTESPPPSTDWADDADVRDDWTDGGWQSKQGNGNRTGGATNSGSSNSRGAKANQSPPRPRGGSSAGNVNYDNYGSLAGRNDAGKGSRSSSPYRGSGGYSPNHQNNGYMRSFPPNVKAACWSKAEEVEGRDPARWRRDAAGNVVFRQLVACQGCLCHEYDHVQPFSKVATAVIGAALMVSTSKAFSLDSAVTLCPSCR